MKLKLLIIIQNQLGSYFRNLKTKLLQESVFDLQNSLSAVFLVLRWPNQTVLKILTTSQAYACDTKQETKNEETV